MLPRQLRNGILHLAITGKLVEQDQNDEPASVLLEKIRAEKQELIKSGKIKKDKNESFIYRNPDGVPYEKIGDKEQCIAEQIPFEIPSSWEWVRLGSVCKSITAGGDKPLNYSKNKTSELNIPIYSNGEKNNGLFGYTDIARITEPSITVSARGTIGFSVVRDEPYTPIVRLIVLIPFKSVLLRYLQRVFSLLLKKYDGVGTSIQQLTVPMIYPKLIPLPPLAEQKRIVEKLEKLLPLVDEYEENYNELEKLDSEFPDKFKKSILQYAIQGKLVKQDPNDEPASVLLEKIKAEKQELIKVGKIKKDKNESFIYRKTSATQHDVSYEKVQNEGSVDFYEKFANGEEKCINDELPFEIPSSWEWVRLGSCISVIGGTSYNKENVNPSGNIRILRGGNIQDTKLIYKNDDIFLTENFKDIDKTIKENDILIVASTGSKAVIGKPAFVIATDESAQIGAFLRIIRPKLSYLSNFIKVIFSSEYYRKHIRNNVSGTNINNIKEEHITKMLIPLPPLAEQKRIVAKIEELFKIIEPLTEK